MFKCPFDDCSYEGNLDNSFRAHVQHHHKKSAKELWDAIHGPGLCGCPCKIETKFCGIKKGYNPFIHGHASRVKNNFAGANPEERNKKLSESRKKAFANGELEAWNKGLTKEADERIAKYGQSGSIAILSNPSEVKRRSKSMSENRKSGKVPTLYGSDHSQWKGGYSRLAGLAHSLLYKSWKFPKLQAANFKCSRCETTGDLHVHHDGERFATILHEASDEFGFTGQDDFALKTKIAQKIEQIHLERNISGLVLCDKCHDAEHERLGESFNILKRVV